MERRRFVVNCVALLGLSVRGYAQGKVPRPKPEKARDPVCGLMVEKEAELSADYNGRTYYFCSKTDRDKFKKTPLKYVPQK